jgi:hypothetical protein
MGEFYCDKIEKKEATCHNSQKLPIFYPTMTPRKSPGIVFIAGIILMFSGVIGGALTYRDMRAQRLLHEEVHLLKFDPSAASQWMSAPLHLYQDGPHAVMLALSGADAAPAQFNGVLVVLVQDPGSKTVMNVKVSSFGEGELKPGRVRWFLLDTLAVKNIVSSEWKIEARLLSGDAQFAGTLGELVVIPPGGSDFTPYLQHNAYKLYGAGLGIVLGFLVVIFGGRKSAGVQNT